jgi:hypothetical protein
VWCYFVISTRFLGRWEEGVAIPLRLSPTSILETLRKNHGLSISATHLFNPRPPYLYLPSHPFPYYCKLPSLSSVFKLLSPFSPFLYPISQNPKSCLYKDGILDTQFNKGLNCFAPTYSQPFYWLILQKTILYPGLKSPYKKICETRKTQFYSWIAFCRKEKRG